MLGNTGSYEGYNFSVGGATGVIAAGLAAASEIFQFRWTSTQTRCRILCAQMSAAVGATGFAAGAASFDMAIARVWSADGTGGATLTPSRMRSKSQNASLVGTVRIATTAALGAGTKAFDTSAINNLVGGAGTAGTPIVYPIPLYVDWASYGVPLVLDTNEGFSIRATVPATGVWTAGIWVAWAEVD